MRRAGASRGRSLGSVQQRSMPRLSPCRARSGCATITREGGWPTPRDRDHAELVDGSATSGLSSGTRAAASWLRVLVSALATQPCVRPRRSAETPCGTLDSRNTRILPAPSSGPSTLVQLRKFSHGGRRLSGLPTPGIGGGEIDPDERLPGRDRLEAPLDRHGVACEVRVRVAEHVIPDIQVRIARAQTNRPLHRRDGLRGPTKRSQGSRPFHVRARSHVYRVWDASIRPQLEDRPVTPEASSWPGWLRSRLGSERAR